MSGRGEVLVRRGGAVESAHRVHAVIVGLEGDEELRYGDPDRLAHWRSSMKPFQALPMVADGAADALGLGEEHVAVCCASHVGTPAHLELVGAVLDRAGAEASDLACGPHPPFDGGAARAVLRSGRSYTSLHNNCSGKHAGMLAVARHAGWPPDGYREPDHPVQARIREELARWLDVDPDGLAWATDGCGVPTPLLSVRQMARAYARLGRAAALGEEGPARVVGAMTAHPEAVSGAGRPTTRLMADTGGRLLAKEGAEGVFCLAGPGEGWGLALKVEDGGRRAAAPAVVEALADAGLLAGEEAERLEAVRRPELRNSRDEVVGRIEGRMEGRRTATAGRP